MTDELRDEGTYGSIYGPAMDVQTEEEAKAYFAALVRRHIRLTGDSDEEATRVERINVGYYAGYYDADTRQRVYSLYGFGHPFFGRMEASPDQLLNAGKAYATLSQASDEGVSDIEAFGRAVQQGIKWEDE